VILEQLSWQTKQGVSAMKIAFVIAILGSVAAGSAAAAAEITDIDYLRANRCKGLAVGSGVTDSPALDAYLKEARRGRFPAALTRGDQEFDRAKKDARHSKERYAAELSGACAAYRGGSQTAASPAAPAS
jgi:hypothetical protein